MSDAPWRRLDPRMLVVGPVNSLVRLVPLVVVLLITGRPENPVQLWIGVGVAALVVLGGVASWRTTRYRITAERVELHSGWLRRSRRSLPRDRIRTVDLTASLLHRVFGLSVVRVGAASGGPQELTGLAFDAVSRAEADRLRRELLDRSAAAPDTPSDVGETLARLDWSWLRYAPLTFSSVAGVGAFVATLVNLLDDLGVDPVDNGALDELETLPLWTALLVGLGLLVLVAVGGAVALYAERWYDYRLTRGPDGTLRVRRGLLTSRSLSVSDTRLRGVELVEPLLLRAGRGAQSRALSTGLSRGDQGGALQPPAPRAEALRVASAALREPPAEIVGAALTPHPPAARTRRLTRALVPAVVVVAAVLAVLGWPALPVLLLLPAAALLGLDRARSLGHALTGRYLVARQGSLVRRTVAVARDGVIGVTIRQSPFQRRAGLVTLEAATAAGGGGYSVLDVAATDGAALADAVLDGAALPFSAAVSRTSPG